jgi:hypothetical protein
MLAKVLHDVSVAIDFSGDDAGGDRTRIGFWGTRTAANGHMGACHRPTIRASVSNCGCVN